MTRWLCMVLPLVTLACADGDKGDDTSGSDSAVTDTDTDSDTTDPEPCDLHSYYREQQGEIADCTTESAPWDPPPGTSSSGGHLAHRWAPLCIDGSASCAEEEQARCLDGTRPAYYVDPAECETDGTCADGVDRWVFFFQGGGSCGDLSWCYDDVYTVPADAGETSTAHPSRASDLADHVGGDGILSERPDNTFADAHRVKIYKCSFDRFQGDATVVESDDDGQPVAMHFHGRRIIQAVLADLARANGTVTVDDHDLPDFADASDVLVTGNSGGAGGLIQNVDWLADQIATHAPGARVVGVLDARFQPGAATEAAFEKPSDDCDSTCDAYTFDRVGTSTVEPDSGGAAIDLERDFTAFETGGIFREFMEALLADDATAFDASCASFHGADPTPCFSEPHVVLNHLGTEVFLHEALFDGNHVTKDPGFWITSPADFLWDGYAVARAGRVVYQADTFLQERGRAEEPGPRVGLFLPGHTKHVSLVNDPWFLDGALCKDCGGGSEACFSYHDALVEWLGRSDEFAWVDEEPVPPGGGAPLALSHAMADAAHNGWRWQATGACP